MCLTTTALSRFAFLCVVIPVAIIASAASVSAQPQARFVLAGGEGPPPAIVHGPAQAAEALSLRDALHASLGVEPEVVLDEDVMEPGTWRLAEPWLHRSLIALGNVDNNRVIFALFSQFFAGVNSAWPGPGSYVLRTLFQPFRRDADILVIGGSDADGLAAGVARFAALADAVVADADGVRALAPIIEIGDAGGPRPASTSKGSEFVTAVQYFYWRGSAPAGRQARDYLLADIEKREEGLWGFNRSGHYHWEAHYRALRQLIASGILSAEEVRLVDRRLLTNALDNKDAYGAWVMRKGVGGFSSSLTRHPISALTGQFIIFEYLHFLGHVPEEQREAVDAGYEHMLGHVQSLVDAGRFQSNLLGIEGMDVLNNMAALYLHLGDGAAVSRGLFAGMADFQAACVDNLGRHVGDDSYITCRPGSHYALTTGGLCLLLATYFSRDGQYRWLTDNTRHFYSHLGVRQPPELTALASGVAPEAPSRYIGLQIVPMDPRWYKRASTYTTDEIATPIDVSPGETYSKAVLREGFDADDAYLHLQGLNTGTINRNDGFQGNAIVRYTELGSLLLFANTMKHSSWARTVVSASRGAPDPQSTACVLVSTLRTPRVTAIQSRMDATGGCSWTRTIVRRRRGYFVVLDELTAREEDDYNFTARWRSFHPGDMVEDQVFEAVDGMRGTTLRIASATPVTWRCEMQERDGGARPTMVQQLQQAHLSAGQTIRFQNLMWASNDEHPRAFETRALSPQSVLVAGDAEGVAELAAIGTGALPLSSLDGEARIWYVLQAGIAASGVRRLELAGGLTLQSPADLTVWLGAGDEPGGIENPGEEAVTCRLLPAPGAQLIFDGEPVDGDVTVPPGAHELTLRAPEDAPAALAAELSERWEAAPPASAVAVAPPAVDARFAFQERWTLPGTPPPHALHGNVRMWGEPEVEIGEAATWRNGLVGPPSGYGWHGSERAGWLPGTEGAIMMDLGAETSVEEIKLIRSRRAKTEVGAFWPGEFVFELTLSNDGFRNDVRHKTVTNPRYEIYYKEYSHYTHTMRFPAFVVPVRDTARYIRLVPRRVIETVSPPGSYYGTYRDGETSFMEIEVYRTDFEPRRKARLVLDEPGAPDRPCLYYQAGETLAGITPAGQVAWQRDLGSAPAAELKLADVDGDGSREIVCATLAEQLLIYDMEGTELYSTDVREQVCTHEDYSRLRPNCIGAWRPDADGRLEFAWFPHYSYVRIGPVPEMVASRLDYRPGFSSRGAKFAFPVPDVTGDGIEELGLVGTYGMGFGVVSSEAPLESGQVTPHIGGGRLTGYSSGNMELKLFFEGAVVRDRAGEWLGCVSVNPGGVDFFAAPDFEHKWGRFHHPSNLCMMLAELSNPDRPDVLIGREDGYVVAYDIETGETSAKVGLAGEVRALTQVGEFIVAGTSRGLFLLDRDLEAVGYRDGAVEDCEGFTLPDGSELIVVARSSGELAAYTPVAGPR
ncbi:MAG: hypothetical protein J7M38_04680 [Armatimonadetes bacterium]|nr:hypothetical protein [Armatimonadota bacterium]